MLENLLVKETIQSTLKFYQKNLDSFGVESLHLFGSVARNEAERDSDIDFLVKFKPGLKNFDNYMNLIFLLEELFNTKVDLFTMDSISGSIKNSIERELVQIQF